MRTFSQTGKTDSQMKCALVDGNAYGSKQDACHTVMFSSMACRVKLAIVQVTRDSCGCGSSSLAKDDKSGGAGDPTGQHPI